VWVRNLHTGRVRGVAGETGYDLVVTPKGTMAWTNFRLEPDQTFHHDLWILGQTGDPRRIDADVALGTLALGGTTLYWKRGGAAQSAPIE
jgi:hypothetical protein